MLDNCRKPIRNRIQNYWVKLNIYNCNLISAHQVMKKRGPLEVKENL